MFKNLTVGKKIGLGFGILIAFISIVGITSFVGFKNLVGEMQIITNQMEVTKGANAILAGAQDTQANALRFVIYGDKQYSDLQKENVETVFSAADHTKDILVLDENKNRVGNIRNAMQDYYQSCSDYVNIQGQKDQAGQVRAAAAAELSRNINSIQNAAEDFTLATNKDGMVDQGAAERTFLAHQCVDALNENRIWAWKFQAAVKIEDQRAIAKSWKNELGNVRSLLDECKEVMVSDVTQEAIKNSYAALDTYEKQVDVFQGLNEQHQKLQETQHKESEEVMSATNDLLANVYNYINEVQAKAKNVTSVITLLVTAIAGSTFVIGILAAIFITLSITKPINRIIDSLTLGSESVAAAAGQVSSASQSLAEGATEQAAGLEETSSSLEEISSMTKQNADNASQADILSKEAKQSTEKGLTSMAKMNDAINKIQVSSNETAKIIKVIDEIAFQTNLLALNAAVEAARAGEAGKGFAVVAEEVRNLAMRSAEAAKNTTTMIEESVQNSRSGVEVADEVKSMLDEISSNISKTSDLVGEIAAASTEQSQGIDQVNQAVSQMDQVTQSNAGSAEESASASEELTGQAKSMKGIVDELVLLTKGASGLTGSSIASEQSSAKSGRSDDIFHQIIKGSQKKQTAKKHEAAIPMCSDDDFKDFNG